MTYRPRRRDKVEILLEILHNAKTPCPPTRLMNKCNMSWVPLKKKLMFLVKKGFIKQLPPPETSRRKGTRGRMVGSLLMNTEKANKLLEMIGESTLYELFAWEAE